MNPTFAQDDRDERRAARAERQAAREERRAGKDGGDGQAASREERRAARQALRDDPQMRARAQDFVSRYTAGDPREGYDDQEAVEMFERVREEATPEEMQAALRDTVRNMTPAQRQQFEQLLGAGGGGARMGIGGGSGGGLDDLLGGLLGGGAMAGGSTGGSPFGSLLGGLLGGAGQPMPAYERSSSDPIGGMLGALMGGGQANPYAGQRGGTAAAQSSGGGLGDLLGGLFGGGQQEPRQSGRGYAQAQPAGGDMSGLMKVLLGGIAAFAMKQMLDKR